MNTDFLTWDQGDSAGMTRALAASQAAIRDSLPVVRTMSYASHRGVGEGGASVRDEFSRRDLESFRGGQRTPRTPRDVVRRCHEAYDEHAIVRNVVDMMADFVVQGITLNHPRARQEKWWREWARRAQVKDRSEQIVRALLVGGLAVVTFETAKINVRVEKEMKRATAADLSPSEPFAFERREVPWRYTIQNPMTLEVADEPHASLAGPSSFEYSVSFPRSASRWRLAEGRFPDSVLRSARSGVPYKLDPNKTRAVYYKKFDWQAWPTPMLRPLLKDLDLLERMKLADAAALDGVISSIRIWRLGSLEHRIVPNAAAITRLSEMLLNNVGGGVMDLVWGPDIELRETSTEAFRFLGPTKYEPVLNAIFQGLGIPPSLTGTNAPGGFTNNFISVKTLVERLEYVRDKLVEFWDDQVRLVQKAMEFASPPSLSFDRMTLTDEASEKQILINLADRDLISWETLVDRFGGDPAIEEVRLRRERRQREKGKLPPKASPFHPAREEGEGEAAPKGQPGQGRPRNAGDAEPRKRRSVLPRSAASFLQLTAWADGAGQAIQKIVGPAFLKHRDKASFRELSEAQAADFEQLRFRLLCRLEPEAEVSREGLALLLSRHGPVPEAPRSLLAAAVAAHAERHGKAPTTDALRRYQSGAYALWKGSDDQAGDGPDHGPSPLPRA